MIQWDTWEYRKFRAFLLKLGIKSATINNKPSILRGKLLRLKIDGKDVSYAAGSTYSVPSYVTAIGNIDTDGDNS